ncbi:MucB/RseB C-terminal domain-containing protein [Alkalimarinus alittae]|uniref:MucB/RseB C-terminal domain-containing protein n=1 Tax=Alkalimarinus alittae TaxID=2961619 RepID=A0ABY6MZG6_9ALTE|nr:MucB/RseB C-terminal domain-containing protein [Alkalimarinus alittae]UZE95233.1 MucB/RseB C-terminal domain-containing protein [Alkalimarinus alittae]
MSQLKHQLLSRKRVTRTCLCILLLVSGFETIAANVVSSKEEKASALSVQKGNVWLERMAEAMQTQNYRGVFVYSRGNISSSMKVIHRYQDGEDREKLVQLDGEMGEIIRTGDELVCVLPGNKVVSLEQSIPSGPFAGAFARRLMPRQDQYLITVEGGDRIAGHHAVKIAIMAKDSYRYSYVLWLERQSGLLLRSNLINLKGEVLEQFHYTSLELNANISDAELASSNLGNEYSHESLPSIRSGSDWTAHMGWRVGWLPDGFLPVNKGVIGRDNAGSGNVQVFTDGLASFSVFIEKPSSKGMPEGATVIGATVAYVDRLQWQDYDYKVTIVGELPIAAVIKIAEKIVPDIH